MPLEEKAAEYARTPNASRCRKPCMISVVENPLKNRASWDCSTELALSISLPANREAGSSLVRCRFRWRLVVGGAVGFRFKKVANHGGPGADVGAPFAGE